LSHRAELGFSAFTHRKRLTLFLGHREPISITRLSLSELTTLVGTFSSEPSMGFRISVAPGMPARKTLTLTYVSNMLYLYFLVQIVGHTDWGTFSIALIFILFQPAEKSYLASMAWLQKEAQLNQGQNSHIEALKH